MELLAPAGNIEKMRFAFRYGADAVYAGLRDFSMRNRGENFGLGDAEEVRALKERFGGSVFGAFNIAFNPDDIRRLEEVMERVAAFPFDALIVSDLGAAAAARRHLPEMPLHLSTQANCLNGEAALTYAGLGFRRIILGRELSLRQIEQIKERCVRSGCSVEFEVFVHGALCLAYAGRCFLSRWMAGRSANRGECAQPCRWRYKARRFIIEEELRPGELYEVEEHGGPEPYTTILSSRDIMLFDHLRRLRDAGVDAVKIEGRMKSLHYAALVARSYRWALDVLKRGGKPEDAEGYTQAREALFTVSHRDFGTGFLVDEEREESVGSPAEDLYHKRYLFVAVVTEKSKEGFFRIDLRNKIRSGDWLEFVGPHIGDHHASGRFALFRLTDDGSEQVDVADRGNFEYAMACDLPLEKEWIIRIRQ